MFVVLASSSNEEFNAIVLFQLREDAVRFCEFMTDSTEQGGYFYSRVDDVAYKINHVNLFRHSHLSREEIRRRFHGDPNLSPDELETLEFLSIHDEEAPQYVDPNFETPPPRYLTPLRFSTPRTRANPERGTPQTPSGHRYSSQRNLFGSPNPFLDE